MLKALYKPFGIIASVLGGILAGKVFSRVWQSLTGEDEKPKATDYDRTWTEVLAAAAVQGAVFGGVKALVDRAGATGFAKATGAWPGEGGPKEVVTAV